MKWLNKHRAFWLVQALLLPGKWVLVLVLNLFISAPLFLLWLIAVTLRVLITLRSVDSLYQSYINTYRIFAKSFLSFRVIGKENIPKGGAVVIARHRSVHDVSLAMTAFGGRRVKFLARSDVFRLRMIPRIKSYVIFIDREGLSLESVRKAQTEALDHLKSGKLLVVFPEGSRKPKHKNVKAGAVRFAKQAKVPVVPLNIQTEGPYHSKEGSSWSAFRRIWDFLLMRIKVKAKIGKPMRVEEIKKAYRKTHTEEVSAKNPRLTKFLLEKVVDQV